MLGVVSHGQIAFLCFYVFSYYKDIVMLVEILLVEDTIVLGASLGFVKYLFIEVKHPSEVSGGHSKRILPL